MQEWRIYITDGFLEQEGKDGIQKSEYCSINLGTKILGPPGCGKSEFPKKIREHFEDDSLFIDRSYGSKAGIFEKLYEKRPRYVLLDEIDKLTGQDQQALLNLMQSGILTRLRNRKVTIYSLMHVSLLRQTAKRIY
jgi:hypothetical protein